jgi:hypothetical protein
MALAPIRQITTEALELLQKEVPVCDRIDDAVRALAVFGGVVKHRVALDPCKMALTPCDLLLYVKLPFQVDMFATFSARLQLANHNAFVHSEVFYHVNGCTDIKLQHEVDRTGLGRNNLSLHIDVKTVDAMWPNSIFLPLAYLAVYVRTRSPVAAKCIQMQCYVDVALLDTTLRAAVWDYNERRTWNMLVPYMLSRSTLPEMWLGEDCCVNLRCVRECSSSVNLPCVHECCLLPAEPTPSTSERP